MIGNDVVDLTDPEANPKGMHPRFDTRVFERSELERIRASDAPDRLRWMLWAAKEAAYKALKKIAPHAIFSPRRFAVELNEALRGKVTCAEHSLPVQCSLPIQRYSLPIQQCSLPIRRYSLPIQVWEEAGCVHAVATTGRLLSRRILSGTEILESGGAIDSHLPGRAARGLAIRELSGFLGVPAEDLSISRRGRVPTLLCDGESTDIDLSLSHHGRLVAFACEVRRP